MESFIVIIAVFMIDYWSHTATGSPGSVGIRFSESDYRAEENAGAVEVLLVRPGKAPDDITLTVTPLTLEDAARRGIEVPDGVSTTRDDYVNYGPVEVVFPADSSITSVPVSIPIVNDDINEADERFIVVLESNSSVDLSGRNIAFCEISNDDDIAIGFEKKDYVLTEGQETTISIVKNRETKQEFAVHLDVSPFLAVLGVDVNITSRLISLVFPPSEQKLVIPIKAIDDSIPENVESLEMIAKYALPGTTLGTSCTEAGCHPITKVKIIDNDEVEVSLEKSNLTVREDAGAVTVCVLITRPTGPIDCVVNVYVTTQPGTAGEAEFVETSKILTLHGLRNRQCFDVMIIDDSVAEETKVFAVYLSGRNTDRLPQLLYGETSIAISILDDESVGIRFSESDYRAEENARAVEVLLVRSGIVPDDIILTVTPLTLEDATRKGIEVPDEVSTTRDDYVNYGPVEVVFPADSSITRVPVSIPIVDNNINEADERFVVVLESNSSLVDLSIRNIAFCEISDDDDIAIGFEEEDYVLTEGQETTISIVKNRETEQEFAVHLEVSPLAMLGVDVNITSQLISLVFSPSEQKLVIPIKAIDDSIPENVESLEMIAKYALPGTTLGTSCTEVGCHPITKVKIIDNDGPNECDTNNGGCSQTCTDTEELFRCSCRNGYTLASDGRSCNNINECNTNNGGCSHTCTDTVGSYQCSCDPGYQLSLDQHSCVLTATCGVLTEAMGFVESVGWPEEYSKNSYCDWTISLPDPSSRVQITFNPQAYGLAGNPPCTRDYVEVFDGPDISAQSLGRFCGCCADKTPDSFIASGSIVKVVFHSGPKHGPKRKGFHIDYQAV